MDYKIEAIAVLWNENCILQRYYPLIPYKETLLKHLRGIHCTTKCQCSALSDDCLLEMGLPNQDLVNLFRRFLVLYDVKSSKFNDIEEAASGEEERSAFRDLYLLPGVKATRARLYYDAGYSSLAKIASAAPEQIIRDTEAVILQQKASLKAPLLKEVRTHIAVAKAFTAYAVPDSQKTL